MSRKFSTRFEALIRDMLWSQECDFCRLEITSWSVWEGVELGEYVCDSCHDVHFTAA